MVKPHGFWRVGRTPDCDWMLFEYPEKVGSGKYCSRLAEAALKQLVGMTLPMNCVPGLLPFAVQLLCAGLKMGFPSALKSPAFSAAVGTDMKAVSVWLRRYHSALTQKKVRFLPL